MAKDPEVQSVDGVPVVTKTTAAFTASEIAKAQDRTADFADKAAERQEESHEKTIAALKEAHASAIDALKTSMAGQIAAEEKRGALYLKGLVVAAGLFALSLIGNIVLISGVFRTDVNVTPEGAVTIGNHGPSTPAPDKAAPEKTPAPP